MLTTFSSCGKFVKSTKKGKGWNVLGTSPSGSSFERLVVDSNGIVYASSTTITSISSVPVNQLGMYNPTTSTWTSIVSEIMQYGSIKTLALDSNNNLYIAGYFTTLSGQTVNHIAKWDPITSTWSALGTGLNVGTNESINSVTCDSENNVYVCGGFTKVGHNTINAIRVAKYTVSTQTWSAFGSGIISGSNIHPLDICVDTNFNVYIAGLLNGYGHVMRWNGTTWSVLGGTGLNQESRSVTTDSNNNVYVSGSFTSANGISVPKGFAMWNGTVWTDLGASAISELSLRAHPRCVKIGVDNKLYVATDRICVYDGSAWSVLHTFNHEVRGMHIDDQLNIYAAGLFRIDNNHCVVKYS
jgi:hypothetical protein